MSMNWPNEQMRMNANDATRHYGNAHDAMDYLYGHTDTDVAGQKWVLDNEDAIKNWFVSYGLEE